MGKVIPITYWKKYEKKEIAKHPNITTKKRSKMLYVDMRYLGQRIELSSGLPDTEKNRIDLADWLNRQKMKMEKGTFVFEKAFPGASEEKKQMFAQLEGREYAPGPNTIVFGLYAESWVDRFERKCKSATKKRDFLQVINDRILPFFQDRTFYQITGVCLEEFIDTLKWRTGEKKGEELSSSRIRNILIPLRAIWDSAVVEHHWELELADPFLYVKRKKLIPPNCKKTLDSRSVLRFSEWEKILEVINPFYLPVTEFMMLTGAIGSEISGLRKMDIKRGYIHLKNSIVRGQEREGLKTAFRERKVYITKAIGRVLDQSLSQNESRYIFTMKSGRPFRVDGFRKNSWQRALRRADVNYRVTYCLRHTFAAWSLTIGVDPSKLVSLMGHANKK
jgi:integrase